ncbi:unnamed protein product [Bathycoccus prasinos]
MKQFAPFLRAKFTSQNKDYDDDFDDSNGQKLHSERIEVEIKSIVEMCVVYVEENVAVLSLFPSTKSAFSHRGTTGKEYSYAEQDATTRTPQSDDKSESNDTNNNTIVSFRPCIDIHLGKVKQIVGSSLRDEKSVDEEKPETNFETDVKSSEFAEMYKRDNIYGGHAILLSKDLETKEAALEATRAFPGGLQIGGGVTAETALEYLENGASHVIVTSYVFHDGKLDEERLEKLIRVIGKKRLVLDLSCRRDEKDGNKYKVVTDRWQKWTDVCVDEKTLERLSEKCDEFLVHGVDVEGKKMGLDLDLVELLGKYCQIPVTYAGGARSIEDLELVKTYGQNRVDVTIGSALDCFGGSLKYADVIDWHNKQRGLLLK